MIICTECGTRNQDRDTFCGSCGKFLEWTGQRVAVTASEPDETPPPTPQRPGLLRRVLDAIAGDTLEDPQAAAEARRDARAENRWAPDEEPGAAAPNPAVATATSTPPRLAPENSGASLGTEPDGGQAAVPPLPELDLDDIPPLPAATNLPPLPELDLDDIPPLPAATDRSPSPEPDTDPGGARRETPVARVATDAALVVPVDQRAAETELTPQPEAHKTVPRRRTEPTSKLRPGDTVCAECGEGNPPNRKFCRRCGHSTADADVVRTPWWRRRYRRGPKVLAAGARPGDPTRSGGRARLRGTGRAIRRGALAVVVVFGLLAGFYPPLRTALVERVTALRDGVTEVAQQALDPARPVSVTGTGALPGHPAGAAFDGFSNTYWAAPFRAGADAEPGFTLDLGKPSSLVQLIVTNGAADDFGARSRPSIINLAYSNEKSDTVTLKDTPRPQRLQLRNGIGASKIRIRVLDVFPAQGAGSVALTEIELFVAG